MKKPILLRTDKDMILCLDGKKLVLDKTKYTNMTDEEVIKIYLEERGFDEEVK